MSAYLRGLLLVTSLRQDIEGSQAIYFQCRFKLSLQIRSLTHCFPELLNVGSRSIVNLAVVSVHGYVTKSELVFKV